MSEDQPGTSYRILQTLASMKTGNITTENRSEDSEDDIPISAHLNSASAKQIRYQQACRILEVDPRSRKWGDITLHPWQVSGVAWMLDQERHEVGGGILADDRGLGKTIQCLTLTVESAERAEGPHRPTIVFTPSEQIDRWVKEIDTRFGHKLNLILYYSTAEPVGISDPIHRSYRVNTEQLLAEVAKLKEDNPESAKTVVLTSYTTWSSRMRHKNSRLDTELAESTNENGEVGETGRQEFKSKWPETYRFGRMILDEGHAIKDIRGPVHRHIAAIPCNHHWVVTATPVINGPLDLKDILALLLKVSGNRSAFDHEELNLLDPKLFSRLFSAKDVPDVAAILKILKKIQLRRVIGSTMDLGNNLACVTIGAQIPPYLIQTIDCPMTPFQLCQYVMHHDYLIQRLMAPAGEPASQGETEEIGGHFDKRIYRRLRHVSFSIGLENLYRATSVTREENLVSDIREWRQKPAGGLLWLVGRMMQDVSCSRIPEDRSWIADYLIKVTPKFSTLLAIIRETVRHLDNHLIILTNDRNPQYCVEALLDALCVQYVSLEESMTDRERSATAAKFKDSKPKVKILVSTFAACSDDLNLHHRCANVVVLEPASDVNTILQAIGLVHRPGQSQGQRIWILHGSNTFDRFVESNQAQKMLGQMVRINPGAFKDLIDLNSSSRRGEVEVEGDNIKVEDEDEGTPEVDQNHQIPTAQANQVVQKLLGQKESLLEWNNYRDLGLTHRQVTQIEALVTRMPQIPTLPPVARRENDMANESPVKKRRRVS